jgi:ABC-type multidrug transport system fused ATPase/permease subunit
MALDGAISVGGLVAVMALSWRVLAPLQVGFLSFTRLEQLRLGLTQLNRLMTLKREREAARLPTLPRTFSGDIAFNRVSFRYTATAEPALLGVSFAVSRGEVVAVAGPSGAGKSTLLALAAGLYQPQAGAVVLDGLDIRQLDPAELRTAIGWVAQDTHLFHGTVAQNLRLAQPTATDSEINQAAVESGLLGPVLTLPDGFHTRLTESLVRRLPDGFKQRLSLARAYVRRAPLYLLDEPAARLDDDASELLMRKLQDLRSHAAVLMVTHRPSHMRAADRLIWMDRGRVVDDGPPDQVLERQMRSPTP